LRRRAAGVPARPGGNLRAGALDDARGVVRRRARDRDERRLRAHRRRLLAEPGAPAAGAPGPPPRRPLRPPAAHRRAPPPGALSATRPSPGAIAARQPCGGRQPSGVGYQAGGPDYLLQFVETRVITENTLRRGFASDEL